MTVHDAGEPDGNDAGAPARVLVIIPTYNERETLPGTLRALRAAVPGADVLVVDDGSPDGTGALVDDAAAADTQVFGMHRAGKSGLGTAYIAGFRWGLERGYDVLVEMDADGSHRAVDLPLLLDRIARGDVEAVVGSRWVPGGSVVNWPLTRKILSRGGNTYTRLVLGLPLRDATAGFRAYGAELLRRIDLGSVASQGYCFQVDMSYRSVLAGARLAEVPITFVERELGESKMSRAIVVEALWRVTVWGVARRTGQVTGALRRRP